MLIRQKGVHVILALPAWFSSQNDLFHSDQSQPHSNKTKHNSPSKLLFNLLSPVDASPPYAAISALGNQLAGDQGHWLRVDPIELMVDAGNIFLVGRDHLTLQNDEIVALLQSLNEFLLQDGLLIKLGKSEEWYLHASTSFGITTSPLYEVMAQDIRPYLAQGSNYKKWHQLMTELQMLLFDHEVNQARQQTSKPLVNSIWPWGEGEIAGAYPLQNYATIWSDDAFVRGLLMLQKNLVACHHPDEFDTQVCLENGQHLITINHYRYGLDKLTVLVDALIQKIQTRQIKTFTIHLGNGSTFFWRRQFKLFR